MRINSIAYHPISYTQRNKRPVQTYSDSVPENYSAHTYYGAEVAKGQICTSQGIFNRPKTDYIREDVNWRDLGNYIAENFDADNTDFYCFACSTGEEAFSLALLLKHIFNKAPIQIHASDIDGDRVQDAIAKRENGIKFNITDFNSLFSKLGFKKEEFEQYFKVENGTDVRVLPEIVDCIEFSQKNILDSIDEFSEERPSVIFARNMWPYVKKEEYQPFADKLYEKLAPNSIIVVGGYEYDGEQNLEGSDKFPDALTNAGFEYIPRGATYLGRLVEHKGIIFKK